ncbi:MULTISPECIES: PmoA family protein [unclassified Curtobacterium]|uniref:PmoA family protein n=1 Tax=unclassified Curtobacterium TaxID=257496 RepID=UPI00382CC3C8
MTTDAGGDRTRTTAGEQPPGVVLVGARGHGRHHRANIDRLVAAGVCTLTALVDPAIGTDRDAGVPVVADVLAARMVGPVDVVVVAAPIAAHLPLALAALEAGADVLLEKTPVTTRAALAELLAAERRTGRVVQVGFQSLGSAALPAFRAGEVVGRVRSAAAVGTWRRDAAYWARAAWAGKRRVGGVDVLDGVVANPLAHAVATALAIVGCRRAEDVARVEVELYRANAIDGDDTSAVRVTTTAGLEATAALTLCAAEESAPTVRVRGASGSATFAYTLDEVTPERGADDVTPERAATPTVHHDRTDLLENLLDHRRTGADLLVPLVSTGAFVEVLEAVRATGPVQIDHPHVTWTGEGPERHPVVADVEAVVARAADGLALFSEVGAPWAHATRDEVLHRFVVDAPHGGHTEVATSLDGAGTIPTSVPRPYLHPVRTLGSVHVSAHHPGDHDWHAGVGPAIPDLDGVNCWGGRTYVHGEGYVWRDDHGTVTVDRATALGDTRTVEVSWRGPDGGALLHEERVTTARAAGPDAWELRIASSFRTPADTPVRLGGPGSNGRVGAGYGGFFWRFPACADVDVRSASAAGEDAVHGAVAPWVSWSADFDGRPATIVLEALGHRDPWFVRAAEYPAIGSALAWSSPAVVRPGVPLVRAFRAVVADGRADPVELLGRSPATT